MYSVKIALTKGGMSVEPREVHTRNKKKYKEIKAQF